MKACYTLTHYIFIVIDETCTVCINKQAGQQLASELPR